MRILLAGGGTGGHINPAVAIAGELARIYPGSEFLFAAVPGNMEDTMIPKQGYPVAHIKVAGFYRSLLPWDIAHNIKAAWWLAFSGHRAEEIIKDFKPDIAIGTGGYVSGPIIRKAEQMGIPVFLHEQNAFPGVTTKMLAPLAETVFLAFPEAEARIPDGKHFEVVGNPVRQSFSGISKEEARKKLGLDDHFTIFSVGGSLGATAINRMAADLMQWHAEKGEINHIHGYGKNGRERFPKMLKERGLDLSRYPRIQAHEFIDQMQLYLAAADLVISRAGAITISELEMVGAPSILVPYPYAAENHQYHNGMVLQNAGAALVVQEKDYKKDWLISEVEKFASDPGRVKNFSENAKKLAVSDTCARIGASIKKTLDEKGIH
ncbi:MAG: undecaprenyldiphospho-muramoylpentapeptide beta-N-acetylglucosaminyltransferase [Oscillospiraceae bacterium]|nr:undecaprenyldiphospho-muramoylpentapeptide beta-N-acetylglucosaminyltransferase [Oscillospiraceae bacterium]